LRQSGRYDFDYHMSRTRKLPLYCYREKTRHGSFVFYVRRDRRGPRTRLPDDYGTKSWWEAYYAAVAGQSVEPVKRGQKLLSDLIEAYQESREFTSLANQTRKYRAAQFRRMIANNPDAEAHEIEQVHIHRAMSERTPDAANNFIKAVRGFFEWAVKLGYLASDPTAGISKINVKTDGYHSVTEAEIAQYRAKHGLGTMARAALDVFVLTGARRSDAALLGQKHVINGMIEFQAQKTGEWCYIPILPEMQTIIDAAKNETFIHQENGKPYAPESLGNMMQRWFAEAGLPHCSAHGIRKYSATNFANHGVSAHQLMAVFGWKRMSQAETYTKKVDRRKLAKEAGDAVSRPVQPKSAGQT